MSHLIMRVGEHLDLHEYEIGMTYQIDIEYADSSKEGVSSIHYIITRIAKGCILTVKGGSTIFIPID